MAAGDRPAQRTAIADEVLLADELVEGPRAHPRGERLPLGRRLEERLGARAGEPGRGPSSGHVRESTRLPGRSGEADPGDVHEDPQAGQDREHEPRGSARSGGHRAPRRRTRARPGSRAAHRRRRRPPTSIPRPRAASPGVVGDGRPLAGDELRLELRGALELELGQSAGCGGSRRVGPGPGRPGPRPGAGSGGGSGRVARALRHVPVMLLGIARAGSSGRKDTPGVAVSPRRARGARLGRARRDAAIDLETLVRDNQEPIVATLLAAVVAAPRRRDRGGPPDRAPEPSARRRSPAGATSGASRRSWRRTWRASTRSSATSTRWRPGPPSWSAT